MLFFSSAETWFFFCIFNWLTTFHLDLSLQLTTTAEILLFSLACYFKAKSVLSFSLKTRYKSAVQLVSSYIGEKAAQHLIKIDKLELCAGSTWNRKPQILFAFQLFEDLFLIIICVSLLLWEWVWELELSVITPFCNQKGQAAVKAKFLVWKHSSYLQF